MCLQQRTAQRCKAETEAFIAGWDAPKGQLLRSKVCFLPPPRRSAKEKRRSHCRSLLPKVPKQKSDRGGQAEQRVWLCKAANANLMALRKLPNFHYHHCCRREGVGEHRSSRPGTCWKSLQSIRGLIRTERHSFCTHSPLLAGVCARTS